MADKTPDSERTSSERRRRHWPFVLLAVLLIAAGLVVLVTRALSEFGQGGAGSGSPAITAAENAPSDASTPGSSPSRQAPGGTGTTVLHPVTGSAGAGDPYFPGQGNGGYDVQHYDISLSLDPAVAGLKGETSVDMVSTQDLAALYLDLEGLDVSALQVDGANASFSRSGQELKIKLPKPVAAGSRFIITVTYSGAPVSLTTKSLVMGWRQTPKGIFTLDEPQGAATWFPVNDTPADKATYAFHLTVPDAYTAAANGALTSTTSSQGTKTFNWSMDKPMASYLAAVAVGRLSLATSVSPGGVPIRDYVVAGLESKAREAFDRTGDVIDYYSSLFGPYPFSAYGVVVPDGDTGGAMENQTLSLFGRDVVETKMVDPTQRAIFLSHELAHQWFGDSVTIERWDDVWLNEGFATYASWLWLEHDEGKSALAHQVSEAQKLLADSTEPPPARPGAKLLFGRSTYMRGGLTLHALRLTVGDDVFFATLHAWADRYQYGNVTTADFLALAKQQAPQSLAAQLDALFEAWLYGDKLPDLPAAGGA